MIDAPNLDAMEVKELREFAVIAQMLAQYATLKAQAMEDREVGRINSAMRLETECQHVYRQLPEEVRW